MLYNNSCVVIKMHLPPLLHGLQVQMSIYAFVTKFKDAHGSFFGKKLPH